eukprot:TRINITY_DN6671_c0_g1_i3.p3 TRINITY_DN6671_c0_g1~~TRINITY_DN6671_c0_g1_i3.p3  ORF type:complete len:107 (+),score=21.39 TRINITY_DN6671_c0_g1_i3:130-450(+)
MIEVWCSCTSLSFFLLKSGGSFGTGNVSREFIENKQVGSTDTPAKNRCEMNYWKGTPFREHSRLDQFKFSFSNSSLVGTGWFQKEKLVVCFKVGGMCTQEVMWQIL